MKYLFCLFISVIFATCCLSGYAQNSKLIFENEPGWITPVKIDYNNKKLEAEAEDGYLDVSFEKQISLAKQACFIKKTFKILSEAGVQNGSEISVNFDPAYEQLIFHTLTIVRDGQSINKLRTSDFKIIQQEKELARHMYDGSLTAFMALEDVRKGDIIVYSYTLRGFNPIFAGKYADDFSFKWSIPVPNVYYKLVVPANRHLNFKNHLTKIQPTINRTSTEVIYEWTAKDIAPLRMESKTPEWYDPYESVSISEYTSWNEVSKWANTLFSKDVQLSKGLQKKIAAINENNKTKEQKTLTALHFVQDDIRYMGIEIGINSHKPSNPNKIFDQRFGDCKDKSYLLVTMLNAMGISANPVLLNTYKKQTIKDEQPAATAFDHCTVRAEMNGSVFWFDPTASFQGGGLNDITYPDYQMALVVNDSTAGLAPIPFKQKGLVEIKEVFSVADLVGSATLKVITVKSGSFADDERYYFNNNSVYEIKNKYKDFYASYFDKITVDSLTYQDDRPRGTFTTTEYYTIKDIWKKEGNTQKISLSSYVINSLMLKPSDQNRKMPFVLGYPLKYKEQIEINMPEEWPTSPFDENVSCAGFKLTGHGESTGSKVTLNYEYETLKDHIMPDEAAAFFTKFDEAYDATSYELTYKKTSKAYDTDSTINNSDLFPALGTFPKLYILLGMAVIVTMLIHARQRRNQ